MIEDKSLYLKNISDAADCIRAIVSESMPDICIVLGSGLAPLAGMCEVISDISYKDITGFPVSTVFGHEGRLIYGKLSGKYVFMMSGRFHFYEGYDYSLCTLYVRVMKQLGVGSIFLTNAAGGILDGMNPSDLMVITDHLSFFCESPLRGPNLDEFGVRFPDQTNVYDKEYINLLHDCADELSIKLHDGIYCYSKGPQYETPAEIRAFRLLGGGSVGMSTVPEAIVASHCGMRIAAVSCITNLAAGMSGKPLCHTEVMENAAKASHNSCELVKLFVSKLK